MSGRRTQASAGRKTRLTRAQAATAAAVVGLDPMSTAVVNTPIPPTPTQGYRREETPEIGNPPPRQSKVKALGNKVWKAMIPAPRRKRAAPEPDTSTEITSPLDEDRAAPPKKAKTKPSQDAGSRRRGAAQLPVSGSPRALEPPPARQAGGTSSQRTVLQDRAADEVSSGEEELSDTMDPRQDDDDQSESGDDPVVDDGGDELESRLAAEKPIWQDKAPSVSHSKGKAKARPSTTLTTGTSTLKARSGAGRPKFNWPSDFDNSSGSEFEPRAEDDLEEDELDEEEGTDVEVGEELKASVASSSKTPAKKVKAPSKAQLARQQLETPTWKQVGSSGTRKSKSSAPVGSTGATAASSRPAKLPSAPLRPPVLPVTVPAPTPTSVVIDPHPAPVVSDDLDPVPDLVSDDDDDDDGALPPLVDLVTNPPAHSFVLVFTPGGGPLNINPQQPPVQATLHGANSTVIKNVVFQNSFPDSFGRSKFVADALLEAATVHGYTGLVERLKDDAPFLRSMSGVAKQRISNFRGTIKKAAEGFILGFYGIGALPPAECAEKISFMLDNLTYIYPFVYEPSKRSVPWGKPYCHPCVLALLTTSFFQGPKSIAAKYPDLFPSSLLDRPYEHELPPSMLALVGVAIHAALAEWKSGLHKGIPFAADTFVDVYNEHITTLEGIKFKKVGAYHTMMYRLYQSASNIVPITEPATLPVGTALDHVDVDAMEVD